MLGVLVGSGVIGALAVGWYGYRTLDRIQKWGEKMNELDAIFQSVATAEEMARYAASGRGRAEPKPAGAAVERVAVGVPH